MIKDIIVMNNNKLIRIILIITGTISTGFAILGIFLPLLPTTPLLLLAAACYARSSQKFYNWLLTNRLFGNYIKNYRDGNGVPLKIKIGTTIILWITIILSIIHIKNLLFIKIFLIFLASAVSIHVLKIKTKKMPD